MEPIDSIATTTGHFDTITTIGKNIIDQLQYNADIPMIFSSGLFWCLFILFLPIYILLKKSKLKMMLFVIGFSLYFYYKSSGWFFLMLMGTSLADWLISWQIYKTKAKTPRLLWMWLSVGISLSILGYFKYANFFLWNWNMMVRGNFQPLDIILPVGISFYTFQSISYVVDVYKKKVLPTRSWFDYLFFLSFFPSLVAGPIVRADYFIPQLKKNLQPSHEMIWGGLWLVILGIFKKAVLADYLAQYNDLIFNSPDFYTGLQSLLGVFGYTFQIYCDFSGYSDMAIGLASIMGFKLGINFDSPFQSRNISDFWRRWHISLSSWLRDYVYIPLGGSRKGAVRTYINNFITMVLAGLWHGATWTFVFFGITHGIGLIIHKASKPILKKIPDNFLTNSIFWIITFTFISFSLVFLRSATISDALIIFHNIFEEFDLRQLPQFIETRSVWCIMLATVIIMHFVPQSFADRLQVSFIKAPWALKFVCFLFVVQLVIEFMAEEMQPFIYFQF